MVLMNLSHYFVRASLPFPHVLLSSGYPAVPNPILELQLLQAFSLFPTIPILALEARESVQAALKPSLLQFPCNEAWEPFKVFHMLRPSEVVQ